jgi:hypothetical protein
MARLEKLFVGPYADWDGGVRDYRGDDPALNDLLDGGVLDWNIGLAGWSCGRDCCMPRQPRPTCPRWPMAFEWRLGVLQPGGMDCVSDWTTLDRDAEIAWFAAAYAEELGRLGELVGQPPRLRWGLIIWDIS